MIKTTGADGTVAVTFTLDPRVGAQVAVVSGEWNGWVRDVHVMERDDRGGFSLTIALEAGRRYRFRYLLDGERWENDWDADAYEANDFGVDDSIVDLTAGAGVPAIGGPGAPPRKAAPRKTAATKTAATKTPATKTPATKTAGRKAAATKAAAKKAPAAEVEPPAPAGPPDSAPAPAESDPAEPPAVAPLSKKAARKAAKKAAEE
jgi:hypothetical protein